MGTRVNDPRVFGAGLCYCGCGQRPPIAKVSRLDRGIHRGQPVKYVPGHTVWKCCYRCYTFKSVDQYPRRGKGRHRGRSCVDCVQAYRAQPRRDKVAYERAYRASGRAATNRRRWARAHPDYNRAKCARRRRLLRGAQQEPYTLVEIFIRDCGVCQLCEQPVTEQDGRKRDGPTIDHVVPLARGGDDTPINVQLAHRTCNIRKGATTWTPE